MSKIWISNSKPLKQPLIQQFRNFRSIVVLEFVVQTLCFTYIWPYSNHCFDKQGWRLGVSTNFWQPRNNQSKSDSQMEFFAPTQPKICSLSHDLLILIKAKWTEVLWSLETYTKLEMRVPNLMKMWRISLDPKSLAVIVVKVVCKFNLNQVMRLYAKLRFEWRIWITILWKYFLI